MHEFLPLDAEEVAQALGLWRANGRAGVRKRQDMEPAWPGKPAAVVVGGAHGMECMTLTWGFEPPTGTKPVFNARWEKLAEQERSGRGFWAQARRCVVPARMIWEPSPQGDVPYQVPGMPVFLMAGVWQAGRFSVVTVPASESILPIHPRMPLVLPRGFSHDWLAGRVPAESPRLERADIETADPAVSG